MKRLGIIVVLLLAVACGSSSAPSAPVMTQPTANIAGTYPTAVTTNAGLATFTGCTGDLAIIEGFTVADLADPTCMNADPIVVTQSGSTWQLGTRLTLCAGLTSISTGSGTITGDRIDGVLTFDYSNGVFETDTITNGAAGTDGTVVLRIPRASVSGAATGSCSIVPPAETVLSQTRAGQSYHVGLLGRWK